MKTLIGIPARYGSTRFPGKPLAKIAGKEMLLRVWENALKAASKFDGCEACVATDDQRIVDFCRRQNINVMMTSENCLTGTDRIVELAHKMPHPPEFVVNLQGDNPLCPTWFVEAVISEYYKDNNVETVTPVVNLSWEELDNLREHKKTTPFSGTLHPGASGRCAQLWSQKASIMGIGKFAAGNCFAGEFGEIKGTNGLVRFGRPYTQRPTAFKGWVKYQQGTINCVPAGGTNGKTPGEGEPDSGIIYVALGDWDYTVYGGTAECPYLVDTRDESTFFTPNR